MSSFSHPIKAAETTYIRFGWSARQNHDVQIHKAGCAHEAKADVVTPFDQTVTNENDIYVDDWYYVAPCARKAS